MRYAIINKLFLPVENDSARFAIVSRRGRRYEVTATYKDLKPAADSWNSLILEGKDVYICPVAAKIAP